MNFQITSILITFLISGTIITPLSDAKLPQQMQILGTTVSITYQGQERINQKMQSLKRNQNYYNDFLNRCLAYFPLIEREFQQLGVPNDFKYLALQESTLKGDAVSSSNAVGYWQFKETTAEEYQLQVNSQVDERRNIIASSRAAAGYFKKSYHYLNNWMYSLLSFNLGLTGAKNYISENSLSDHLIIDENTHLYLVHFLAHYFTFKEAYEQKADSKSIYLLEYIGGANNNLEELAEFVLESKNTSQFTGYVQQLDQYNPWLLTERVPQTPGICYSIIVPIDPNQRQSMISKFKPYACEGKVRGHNSNEFYADTLKSHYPYIVRKEGMQKTDEYEIVLANGVKAALIKHDLLLKDFLENYGISQKEFKTFNEGLKPKFLKANQHYYLQKKPDTIPLSYHIAEPGDDLTAISQLYGIRLEKLLEWNELKPKYQLQIGDKIRFNPSL